MLKPSVQTHEQDGILIAEFWDCWRLDPGPVLELRSQYQAHVDKQGRPEIVIDLSGVGFAGSAALGNFVALHREARSRGGRLIFCNVEPMVTETFRVSKLSSLFEFVNDRLAALESIAQGPKVSPAAGTAGSPTPGQARSVPGGLAGAGRLRKRKPESGTP